MSGGGVSGGKKWGRGEEDRKREGERAVRKACHLFSLSLAAMGGKTLYLFCTHALAASTFSSLEWKLRQDKQNPVAVSLILSDRARICFILLGYENTIQYVAVAYEFYLKQSAASVLPRQNRIPLRYKLSDCRLFHSFLITRSITFSFFFCFSRLCRHVLLFA